MKSATSFSSLASRIAPAVACLVALLIPLIGGCSRPPTDFFQGYVEADYVRVGAPLGGTLRERPVARGAQVHAGDVLFLLESDAEAAGVAEAEQRLALNRARVDNLRKGRRPTEIAALEARVDQARATQKLAEVEYARRERLRRDEVTTASEFEQIQSQRDAARAALALAEADLATARLGARDDEIRAAEAEVAAASAAVDRARWNLRQKTQTAPVDGRVHETPYEPGEFVPAGQPVVTLLPPAQVKLRFFVPEARVPQCPPGTRVEYRSDAATDWRPARVRYVATQPEFTPPVIYSRETRAKLVFLIEAAGETNAPIVLSPGQPIEVRLPGSTAGPGA